MKTRLLLVLLLLVGGCGWVAAQSDDWTTLVASEAALITLKQPEKPAPKPNGIGALPILPESSVAMPAPPASNPQTYPQTGGACPGGVCPVVPAPSGSYWPAPYYPPVSRPGLLGRFRR